jgi:hypothetical protein
MRLRLPGIGSWQPRVKGLTLESARRADKAKPREAARLGVREVIEQGGPGCSPKAR